MNDKPKGAQKLIILLFVLLGLSFGLWVQAYSKGAVATPPAILIFGPQYLFLDADVPLRVVAIDALKRERLSIAHFDLSAPGLGKKLVIQGDHGRLASKQLETHHEWQVDIAFKDRDWSMRLPMKLSDSSQRAFDGFKWQGLQTDYAAKLPAHERTFYPLWGSVSSSLQNSGVSFNGEAVIEERVATNPATILDPQGFRMVLDRKGYDVIGPLVVAPNKKAVFRVRSYDPETYYVQAWLNAFLVDMKQIKISDGQAQVSFKVPQSAQREDVFWVSVTPSPWLDAQGQAFISRVDTSATLRPFEQLSWLADRTGGPLRGDPLQNWLLTHPQSPLVKEVMLALQSRAIPPFFQAPLVSSLPKTQRLDFEAQKAANLATWRFPFRLCSLILCLFAMVWVRREVLSHLAWKHTLVQWEQVGPESSDTGTRRFIDDIPWHNLWGILAFLLICALFWGADWVLGLTLNDYRI